MSINTIQMVSVSITTIGLIISIIVFANQTKQFKIQMKLNFLSEYTKRYQDIILEFPENINIKDFDYNNLNKVDRDKTLRYMRAYFDLSSEEYYLWQKKFIDNQVWLNWRDGIKYAFSKKAFIDAWQIIELDTFYYKDFVNFINQEVLVEGL